MAGNPTRRWMKYDGQWRLFRLSESDPRFAGSVEYVPGQPRPDAALTAARVLAGESQPEPAPAKEAEPELGSDPSVESGRGGPATNKRRSTGAGTRRRRAEPAAGE